MLKKAKRFAKLCLLCLVASVALGTGGLFLLNWLYPFPMHRIEDRMTAAASMVNAADDTRIAWRVDEEENLRLVVPYEDISPWLVQATVATEDKRFYQHFGIDPLAVGRAVLQNASHGRRVSGASTISMQTIRLLWPRERVLRNKIREAFRAWQLERLTSKRRILEIYCNLAPYGGNVVGVEAAALRYFGKSAAQLNLAEACLLAGLPQSPARLNPLRHPHAAKTRRDFVISRMLEEGFISRDQAEQAWREEVVINTGRRRLEAEHFAERILRMAGTNASTVRTCLTTDLQLRIGELAAEHGETMAERGLTGPALVVLSVRDGAVLAYVGNAAPAHAPSRLVDGVQAKRQPGSLLKPFIFALLAEKGNFFPSSRVYDLPHAWRDYAPRNMDREWRGEMSAGEALRQSRNVTAVRQLEQLGIRKFATFMEQIGLEPGLPERQGLAAALGVKEQTLLDLTNAYATLGRLGTWLPPLLSEGSATPPARRVLSASAAWLALSALAPPADSRRPRRVWKTGTSWNQLDSWAIAMSPERVVGVWCGRTQRGGAGWTAGAVDALPLALAALDFASTDKNAGWEPPPGVVFRDVCADSGLPPGWGCDNILQAAMLASANAPSCQRHAAEVASPTAASPVKATAGMTKAVRIISPGDGGVYLRRKNQPLALQAEAARGRQLHWFMNGEKIGTSESGKIWNYDIPPGNHRLSVAGESGSDVANIEVVMER